jgi:hypothetical protein
LAESAKINQLLAESANSKNGFDRLLKRSQHLVVVVGTHHGEESSMKTRNGISQKEQLLAAAAI